MDTNFLYEPTLGILPTCSSCCCHQGNGEQRTAAMSLGVLRPTFSLLCWGSPLLQLCFGHMHAVDLISRKFLLNFPFLLHGCHNNDCLSKSYSVCFYLADHCKLSNPISSNVLPCKHTGKEPGAPAVCWGAGTSGKELEGPAGRFHGRVCCVVCPSFFFQTILLRHDRYVKTRTYSMYMIHWVWD